MAKATKLRPHKESEKNKLIIPVIAIIAIVVLAFIFLSAPQTPVTPVVDDDGSVDILTNSMEAASKVNEQAYTIEGEITFGSETQTFTVDVLATGEIDVPSKEMYSHIQIDIPEFGQLASTTQVMESYVIGNKIYGRAEINGETGPWTTMLSETDLWGESQGPQKIMEILQMMDSELVGPATIGGKEAYKVNVMPDVSKLLDGILNLQSPEAGYAMLSIAPEDRAEIIDSIKDVSIVLYIDKETKLPVRGEISMTIILDSLDVLSGGVGQMEMDLFIIMTNDFTSSINIVLPESTKTAMESAMENF